jgi:hypothetical protein
LYFARRSNGCDHEFLEFDVAVRIHATFDETGFPPLELSDYEQVEDFGLELVPQLIESGSRNAFEINELIDAPLKGAPVIGVLHHHRRFGHERIPHHVSGPFDRIKKLLRRFPSAGVINLQCGRSRRSPSPPFLVTRYLYLNPRSSSSHDCFLQLC